jgi:hypothetical protein
VFAFRGFLRRFRGGVPGAPLPAGVPVDRRAELEAELAPVFELLEATQREAVATVAAARTEAERRRAAAREAAAQLGAQTQRDAEAERSAAAANRRASAGVEGRALVDAAAAEVARIDRVAGERAPAMIERLVDRMLQPAP